ncbi:MAG TPA: DUF1735 domain-containing protein [Parapedobacter sp.]|uniref:BT_3987 domain-containing protein n=1 Tax=Parapedobacter sp. TaxID=1958893 RepID=UPI002D0F301F|nr:DUF1735 domain-containing protein [Parapedobacter sp.]HWK57483.1 DUF1735 domain-containing protein [Parapedobacter sp.]
MKVHHMIRLTLLFLSGIMLHSSCTEKVDFGEQYKKTVYMVNSNNLLYQSAHHYGQENVAVLSVYCASSQPITEDVIVQLKFDPFSLDSLNDIRSLSDPDYTVRELLPEGHYELPETLSVTIKAGNQYGTIAIPIRTEGLDPFIPYALPFSIVSNSAAYDINPQLRSIVYEPFMVNGYSGDYTGISSETETVSRTIQPQLKALSANTVLLPIHNLPGDLKKLETNFMVLTIAPDGTTVSITPYGNADVVDLGGNYYDSARQHFELHYQFTDGSGNTFSISESISHINAPVSEEEELL